MSTRKDAKKALKKARKRAEQAADLNPIRTLGDFGIRSNHAFAAGLIALAFAGLGWLFSKNRSESGTQRTACAAAPTLFALGLALQNEER